MNIQDKNDFTRGPIIKKLILFFLPIAAGTLFQQLYNAVDAFVVSKFVGTDALAAVGGSPAVVSNLIIGFCVALTGGCAVVIAQFFGARQMEAVSSAVKTSFLFCTALGLFVGVAVYIFSPQILTVLKTTSDTMADSLLYQRIYFVGSIFLLVFNMGAGILRAMGNSRFPFACLFVSCGLNIVLDILFVVGIPMRVAGVAWATVIAEGVSAVMVTVKLFLTKEPYRLRLRGAKWSWKILGRMLRVGIPSGIQSSMYGLSNMLLQVGVNSLETTVVASWAMSGKIDGVFWATTNAFGTALPTFIGQNFGARNYARVRETARKSLFLFAGITVGISALILLLGMPALNLLTEDQAVIDTTWYIMLFFVPAYILWSVIEVYSGVLRGIGDTTIPSILIATGICGVRVLWIFTAFAANPTLEILCFSYPISWAFTDIVLFLYYKWRAKRLEQLPTREI